MTNEIALFIKESRQKDKELTAEIEGLKKDLARLDKQLAKSIERLKKAGEKANDKKA